MGIGFWIVKGDKTSCGGSVLEGTPRKEFAGRYAALNGHQVSCGKHPGIYHISGGHPGDLVDGMPVASTLYSRSTCPCRARFIPSQTWAWHGPYQDEPVKNSPASTSSLAAEIIPDYVQEPEQNGQTAKKKAPPEPLHLPALIYQTKRQMDDYKADDMYHGDLDTLTLRNHFRIDVDTVSMKVNPFTLRLVNPLNPYGIASPYAVPETQKLMPAVSKTEAAVLMFDEFRELAKLFSFQGVYQKIITEMITHMQRNNGALYSNPLFDEALKEQIINDKSNASSLLKIKEIIHSTIDFEYGFIPLNKKDRFEREISGTVLPKFNRLTDRTNGLVLSVHDTWATHITLESFEVRGNTYKAKVHYRIQDHFGLDDTDVLNPIYRELRIFRLWFTLQRWNEYGYRPFITEMNATIDIAGRYGE